MNVHNKKLKNNFQSLIIQNYFTLILHSNLFFLLNILHSNLDHFIHILFNEANITFGYFNYIYNSSFCTIQKTKRITI